MIFKMISFQGLAGGISQVATEQMVLYKTCRDKKFNQTIEFCSDIENHTNDDIYKDIESEVMSNSCP